MTPLVVAKAPEPGRVKTRLGAEIGAEAAAEVAAAALLDTLAACRAAFGPGHVSLGGDLDLAVRRDELRAALAGWTVHPQPEVGFGARLAAAHAEVPGPVIQVGMDTPQATPELLREAAAGLDGHDAVLGPAEDGGWWVLAVRDPATAEVLAGVPMSTPTTYTDTRAALLDAGHTVGSTVVLRDVDTRDDAEVVAHEAPDSEFGRCWAVVA